MWLFDSKLLFEAISLESARLRFSILKTYLNCDLWLSTIKCRNANSCVYDLNVNCCNALLGGCSARLINKLKMIQNAAARVFTRTRKYDNITLVLSHHCTGCLSQHRIDFKILLITYKALKGLAPQYLSELLSHYSPPRPLCFQNSGRLIIHRLSPRLRVADYFPI